MSPELNHLLVLKRSRPEPKMVVHCGSTLRAMREFEEWRLKDTLEGHIVLTIGANKNDIAIEDAIELDILHLFKIDKADLVRIFNPKGYIGPSTRKELEYARMLSKEVWFLEPPEGYHNPQLVHQMWRE
jgi:hypothetical protein